MNKVLSNKESEKLLALPGEFVIKVVGINDPRLLEDVSAIIAFHTVSFRPGNIASKLSPKGNYVSLNITIWAESKMQLDAIYLALNQHKLVKITL